MNYFTEMLLIIIWRNEIKARLNWNNGSESESSQFIALVK